MAISLEDGLKQAEALARRGETQRAKQLYQALLEKSPADRQAKEGLAALEQRSAEFEALSALYQRGEFHKVLAEGERLLARYPSTAFLLNLLGAAHAGLGHWEEAVIFYKQGIALRPDIAQAHVNLGKALSQLGRQDQAILCFRNAIRIKPGYADAHYSLGIALHLMQRDGDAVAAYQQAIGLRPDFAEAYDNLGIALRDLGHFDEAAACFRQELQLRPKNAATHVHLGIALGKAGRYPESNAAFDTALTLQPDLADTKGQKLFQLALMCDWDALASETKAIASLGLEGPAVRPFVMLPLEDAPARHRIRAERFCKERFALPEPACFVRPSARPERIRIGYFSANFHTHAVMYLMARLFELHDRSRFEIHAYSYGPEANDEMRARVRAAVEFFHEVRGLKSPEIAELSRKNGIDIAVDLMGHTENARSEIFAHRAAPLQINYLGYPGTSGAPYMDYLIADRTIVPQENEPHYSEKIISLPHTYMPSDDRREISDRAITRKEAGLPEKGVVFCCFNNIYKIGAQEFALWLRLLRQVEGSVLWLNGTNEWAKRNLRKEAEKSALDPGRIIFTTRVPMAEHLARQRLADLFLDTFNYNAHSTASDALWVGLPIVTRAGQGFAARVAASLLTAIGLPELITRTAEAYEQLALALARDPEKLVALKTKLAGLRNSAPLFDSARFTRHLENAYTQIYQRYFDGDRPTSIHVAD